MKQAIHLRFDDARDSYEGWVSIELFTETALPFLRLDSDGLEIDGLRLYASSTEDALAPETREPAQRDLGIEERQVRWTRESASDSYPRAHLRITPASPLPAGRHRLEVDFRGELATAGSGGLFRVREGDDAYVFPFLQPDYAHSAFPCFDRPDARTLFELQVEVPAHHRAFANTPSISDTVADGRRTVRFAPTRPISTYLLALAAGPFQVVDLPELGKPARLILPAGRDPRRSEILASQIRDLLPAAEDYFARPYPFAKLDWIWIPGFPVAGMESPGLVALAETVASIDPDRASDAERRRLARLVAHEIAHMWFGNLVTPADWSDLWLNESFALRMEEKIVGSVYPRLAVELDFARQHQQAQADDALSQSRPVTHPAGHPRNLIATFGPSMAKGNALLAMLESWIGEASFRRAIRHHLNRYSWGVATTEDLLGSLERASGQSLSEIARAFLDQPGLPKVSLELDLAAHPRTLHLRQERYRALGRELEPMRWSVPLVLAFPEAKAELATGTNDDGGEGWRIRKLLLDGESMSVPLEDLGFAAGDPAPDFVHPNAGGVGYYRFALPDSRLVALGEAAARGRLSAREIIAFIGNSKALLEAGDLDGGTYLRTLTHLAEHPSPVVVDAVIAALEEVEQAFATAAEGEAFDAWGSRTLKPILERIGTEPRPGEVDEAQLLRPRLWLWLGLHSRDPEILEGARKRLSVLSKPSEWDPHLDPIAIRLAAYQGDAALYERLRKHYEDSASPRQKRSLATALGSFEAPELRKKALAYALEAGHDPRDAIAMAVGSTYDEAGRRHLVQWTLDNYEQLFELLPPPARPLIPTLLRSCSADRSDELRAFFDEREGRAPGTVLQLSRATEQMENCASLASREGEAVRAYLAEHRAAP